MPKQRVNIAVNLDPETPTAGDLGGMYVPGATNLLFSKYTDSKVYAQTRPAIYLAVRRPDGEENYRARGIFYWEAAGKLLVVYDDTLYSGLYGPVEQVIGSGRDPVYWAEYSSTELIMTDPENNKVWLITQSSGVISVADHTSVVQQDLISEGIAGGVVVLDGFCFIMSKAGKVYNSNTGDINTWNPLDFLTTERAVDEGKYLCKQNEHIVAVSSSSTEILYNAGNPEASPLRRRADIAYLIGTDSYKHCHTNGTKLFFIGATNLGSFGMYKLENLKIQQISHQSIDAWINNCLVSFQRDFIVTSGTLGEHFPVYITSVKDENSGWAPINTAVYDDSTQLWGRFETAITEGTDADLSFPIYAITERTGNATFGQTFQLSDGSIGAYGMENTGVDIFGTDPYITLDGNPDSEELYWEPGYIIRESGEERHQINPYFVTEEWDGGLTNNKFMSKLSVVGRVRDRTIDPNGTLTVSYSDDVLRTWSTPRTLNATTHWRWTRMGYFQRRYVFIQYQGDDRVRFEAVEIDVEASEYA